MLQTVLALVVLLSLGAALFIAFVRPPLLKYGSAGGVVDGRSLCAAEGERAAEAANPFAQFFPGAESKKVAAVRNRAVVDCLSETAVNTPLLLVRVLLLLVPATAAAAYSRRLQFG